MVTLYLQHFKIFFMKVRFWLGQPTGTICKDAKKLKTKKNRKPWPNTHRRKHPTGKKV
jgi:hypothetical protein